MHDFAEFDTLEYFFAHEACLSGMQNLQPEQVLWCAVIHRALVDAAHGNAKAADWLLCEKEDFLYVCTLAGISPFCVRTAARKLIES